MRILLSLLAILIAFSALSADEKAKDTAITLKGEKTPGGGYKIYFSDDKSSFLSLTGYTRFQTSWNIDDKQNADAGKFTMPYFRFYVDGQSDKNWSWHTRFDYSQAWFMSRQTDIKATNTAGTKYGAAGLYFARAYVTYSANDNFKVDFGRISNQIYRYDVINNADIKVGYGVMPKFVYKDFSLTTTINYNNEAQRMGPANDNTVDGQRPNQIVTLGGRAGYNLKFNKDWALGFGMMVNGDTQHSYEKLMQLMPDVMLTGPYEFYVINQTLKRVSNRNTPNFYETYTEAGFGVDGFWYPDLNYAVEKDEAAKDSKHTVAAELLVKHSAQISTLWTVIYGNYLAETPEERSKSFKAWIQYDF